MRVSNVQRHGWRRQRSSCWHPRGGWVRWIPFGVRRQFGGDQHRGARVGLWRGGVLR